MYADVLWNVLNSISVSKIFPNFFTRISDIEIKQTRRASLNCYLIYLLWENSEFGWWITTEG